MDNSTKQKMRFFFKGFNSAFDISGGMRIPDYHRGAERDREALANDWKQTGGYVRGAINRVAYGQ